MSLRQKVRTYRWRLQISLCRIGCPSVKPIDNEIKSLGSLELSLKNEIMINDFPADNLDQMEQWSIHRMIVNANYLGFGTRFQKSVQNVRFLEVLLTMSAFVHLAENLKILVAVFIDVWFAKNRLVRAMKMTFVSVRHFIVRKKESV